MEKKDPVEEAELVKKVDEALEKNLKETLFLLLQIAEIRVPGAMGRATLAKDAAEYVAQKLDLKEDEVKRIRRAATLHEIGKVGLPDDVIVKKYEDLSPYDRSLFQKYPVVGSMLVSTLSGLKESARDMHHQLENFDGSGLPDHLMEEEIPIGARILRAINFCEALSGQGKTVEDSVQEIHRSAKKELDPRVAFLLAEFLTENNKQFCNDTLKLQVNELMPGMKIAQDIYTYSGTKLLPKEVRLQEQMLRILIERNEYDPIPGGVYVYNSMDTPIE